MANSKLIKEAIADAKAVRETAIASAKLALEEAFTPKLQSIFSKKIQAEMEDDDYDSEEELDELDTSKVGTGDNVKPSTQPDTELDPETQKQTSALGAEDDNNEKVDDLTESEDEDDEDVTGATYDVNEQEDDEDDEELDIDIEDDEEDVVIDSDDEEEYDEDQLDLESIIRELEDEMDDTDFEDEVDDVTESEHEDDEELDIDIEDDEELDIDIEDDEVDDIATDISDDDEIEDDEIDLDEILREMGLTDDDEIEDEGDDETAELEEKIAALESDLSEAYGTIKSLKGTINEVNLLNAKLLFANKLFRNYNLNNEQKVKVVENLDRTNSVREVKLVYATLSESLKFGGTVNKKAKKLTEGFASTATRTTAPTSKGEIIQEGNDLAQRFKELAGIINK